MNPTDPNRQRTPSLGLIHQQLESEQEAQVNRLLHMIKDQQDQLAALQTEHSNHNPISNDAAHNATSALPDPTAPLASESAIRDSRSPSYHSPRSPLQRPTSLSRHSSRGGQVPGSFASNASSPSLRPLSTTRSHEEWTAGGVREEGAFYQAETHMLQRENQMLKMRIRELERQITELDRPSTDTEVAMDSTVSSSQPS